MVEDGMSFRNFGRCGKCVQGGIKRNPRAIIPDRLDHALREREREDDVEWLEEQL